MSPTPTPSPAGGPRPPDPRSLVLLGAAIPLGLVAGLEHLLLPRLENPAVLAEALATAAALLAAGWWWSTRRGQPVGRLPVLFLGALALAGACVAPWLLPRLHLGLVRQVVLGSAPDSALVAAAVVVATAPFALALGGLIGAGLAGASRRGPALLLAGTAGGLAILPWTSEAMLGRGDTVRAAGLLVAASAVVMAERAPIVPVRSRGLPLAHALALATAAGTCPLVLSLARPVVDLGTAGSPWIVAVACASAAGGALVAGPGRPAALDVLTALAVPLAVGLTPAVRSDVAAGIAPDLAGAALVGLPLGWAAGTLLGRDASGPVPRALLPLLLLLPGAVVLVGLVGLAGAKGALACLAALVLAAAWLDLPRPSARRVLAVTALAVGLTRLPIPGTDEGVEPERTWHLPRGLAALVLDDATGREVLAVDGRAPLGRPRLLTRRMVHLPFLLHPARDGARALIVATDLGDAAKAALDHAPSGVDWLDPFPVPALADRAPDDERVRRALGSERLHLAIGHEPYDVIVLMPDPRVRRRAGRTGTITYYEQMEAQLAPDGLFCQWWDLATIDLTDLKAAIGSAVAAFPEVYLAIDHPRSRRAQLAVVGRRAPLRVPLEALEERLEARPAVAADLAAVGLDALRTACLVMQHTGLLELFAPVERAVTDERPLLGVRGGVRPLRAPGELVSSLDAMTLRRVDPLHWLVVPRAELRETGALVKDLMRGLAALGGGARAVVAAHGALVTPFESEPPGTGPEEEARALLDAFQALPDWPYLADLVVARAEHLAATGRSAEAEAWLKQAIRRYVPSVACRVALARLHETGGRTKPACDLWTSVLAYEPDHAEAAEALARLGCTPD